MSWRSSDTAKVAMSGGEVTAVRLGGAVVRASAGSYAAECAVTVLPAGTVTTLAGRTNLKGSSDSTEGTGSSAQFDFPYGTSRYVTDYGNNTIRRID